jgi:hypothetical protein
MIKKASEKITKQIKSYVKNFEINYIMESNEYYICYGLSKGKGNNCETLRLRKDLFDEHSN